jgi:outer membrane usher protein
MARDIPDIPVYLENQVVAHTDQGGRALVSNVRPYEENHISIDPLTLPMEATVNEIEKTVVLQMQ